MAYLNSGVGEASWLQERATGNEIRLGDVERRVILRARFDAQSGRKQPVLADPRHAALRTYAMLKDRRSAAAARLLLDSGYNFAERRIIDAMIDALPAGAPRSVPLTSRLVCAAVILIPLLAAIAGFSWGNVYLQDRLIAVVLGGLATAFVMPLAGALLAPAARSPAA